MNKRNNGNTLKTLLLYFTIGVVVFLVLSTYNDFTELQSQQSIQYTYGYLTEDITNEESGNIRAIEIITNTETFDRGTAVITFTDNTAQKVEIPSLSSFMNLLHSTNKTQLVKTYEPESTDMFSFYLPIFIVMAVLILVLAFSKPTKGGGSSNNSGTGGVKMMSFGKSKAKVLTPDQKTATFKDVAGLKEEKYDLEEVVDFLKSPQKFNDIGARIPKGILLVGPPGTGKTLLARAVAGEAGVQFFTISGSDFVEMFVGVGASRVREMFEEAKKHKPCLIFIDEIDAVGRRRGSGLGGGHDEREQTLNQLLVEMDGFASNEGIVILAATNRVDILDPALLRPGRFDRQIYVGAPDVKGRKEILEVHAKTKKLEKEVNLEDLAKTTAGFTGAELENLLNESAIIAAKKGKKTIFSEDVQKAFIKVGIGTEKKSRVISLEEKKITAYHEAGHAVLAEALPLMDSVHIISIIPTGPAGGYTMHLPVDKGYISESFFYQDIMSLFGGRIAEEIIFNEVTTGASSDINRASKIARAMVTKYGMSSLGPIEFNEEEISQEKASLIDKEVSKIIDKCYEDAKKILVDNLKYLHDCSEMLLEKEKISGDEFRELFPKDYFPKKLRPTFDEEDNTEKEDNKEDTHKNDEDSNMTEQN